MRSSSRSREGRHTATLSTWMLRLGLVKTRNEAIKLIQRGKVLVRSRDLVYQMNKPVKPAGSWIKSRTGNWFPPLKVEEIRIKE